MFFFLFFLKRFNSEPLLSGAVDVAGVFDPNRENVLEIPLRLLFIKFAVACVDENNDDVAVEELAVVADLQKCHSEM